MFKSTKRFGPISTNHRNWHALTNPNRDSRKCGRVHGYSRYVEFIFVGDYDQQQWVVDFGNLRDIKKIIEDTWDHKTLIASDDPGLMDLKDAESKGLLDLSIVDVSNGLEWGPGIEGSCKWLFDISSPIIFEKTNGLAAIESIRIWEHEINSAMYKAEYSDYLRFGYTEDQIKKFI